MAVQFPVLSPGLLGLGLGLGPVDTRPSASSVTGLKLQITVEAKSTAEGAAPTASLVEEISPWVTYIEKPGSHPRGTTGAEAWYLPDAELTPL